MDRPLLLPLAACTQPALVGGKAVGLARLLAGEFPVPSRFCVTIEPSLPRRILVVSVINPGMAPLFGLAAGLVVEMGGTLTRGAIIAREYGLPAVVNVHGITIRLKEGDRVSVDAQRGDIVVQARAGG